MKFSSIIKNMIDRSSLKNRIHKQFLIFFTLTQFTYGFMIDRSSFKNTIHKQFLIFFTLIQFTYEFMCTIQSIYMTLYFYISTYILILFNNVYYKLFISSQIDFFFPEPNNLSVYNINNTFFSYSFRIRRQVGDE